jgi:integrase
MGLIYLKVLINDAKRRGTITSSAVDSFAVPDRTERERFLATNEIQRLLEACRDMAQVHGDIVECLLRTARRKEEVSGMRWEEIDQESWRWSIPASRTKTKEAFSMFLPPQVVNIMERQQPDLRRRTGFVFTFDGTRSTVVSTQAKNTLDAHIHRRMELASKAGQPPRRMDHWVIHDLRTTFGTHAPEEPLCIPSDIVEVCLAHAVGTSKYQKSERLRIMRTAFLTWNDFLDELMKGSDAWPGGRDLPPLGKFDIIPRWTDLRRDWPKRDGLRGPIKPAGDAHD